MRTQVKIWSAFLVGLPLVCFLWLFVFPISYGTGDPPAFMDAVWMFCAVVVGFASVTTFSLWWWVLGLAFFVAFNVRHRANPA